MNPFIKLFGTALQAPKAIQLLILPLLSMSLLLSCTAQAQANAQAVILQYHHVSSKTPPVTSLSPDEFRQHMTYLQDNNFHVMALETVIAALQSGSPLPDKTAVITFDDGYVSVYDTAFPLLVAMNYPFTVFVTAGLVNSNPKLYATWDQLREMGNKGATLANHTVSHPYLLERLPGTSDELWLEAVQQEIVSAEQSILEETGQSHKLVAYPYGEYNPQIQELVSTLGYVGISQHSGPVSAASDFTALPRFPFSGIYAAMGTYITKVNSLALNVSIAEPTTVITDSRSPWAELEFKAQYPFQSLSCFNNNVPMQITTVDVVKQRYKIATDVSNTSRRFRYNCTLPGNNGRYYWYSVPWVNPSIAE